MLNFAYVYEVFIDTENLHYLAPVHSGFLSNPAENLSLLHFPIDYSVKIPCLFCPLSTQNSVLKRKSMCHNLCCVFRLQCIRIAANNRIMLAYRLFLPNCPNFVSGNHTNITAD